MLSTVVSKYGESSIDSIEIVEVHGVNLIKNSEDLLDLEKLGLVDLKNSDLYASYEENGLLPITDSRELDRLAHKLDTRFRAGTLRDVYDEFEDSVNQAIYN